MDVSADQVNKDSIFHNILNNQIDYNNLSIRFTAKISTSDRSDTFRGNLRIQKDSIIWLSFRSLNIEGARLVITPDSLKMINRLENKYFLEKIDFFEERFGYDFNFFDVQAILTNSLFIYPHGRDTIGFIKKSNICLNEDNSEYCLIRVASRKFSFNDTVGNSTNPTIIERVLTETITQRLNVYPGIYRVSKNTINSDIRRQNLIINYDKMFETESKIFPKSINFKLSNPESTLTLDFTVDNLTFNLESISFPFSIPSRYERL